MSVMAVPVDPRLLKEALAQGDLARYEQLINRSRITNSRMPKVSLREKAMRRVAANGPRREFGVTPLMASRGLLILVNYSDLAFQATNTQAQMDSMMNGYNYTYNGATGSSAQYFSDQSNGQYRPHFDVVGPITLPRNMAYYGSNIDGVDGEDQKLGDLVLHACSIASQIDGVDLKNYDADNDGEMDFVYIIYAGKGEADGGASNTIWPASWDMASAVASGYTSLSKTARPSQYTFDGVKIGNFAYSGELNGWSGARNGIGTPTHEFSHVLGLPDFYDTYYGTNSSSGKTPGDWDVMDSGPYNNNGKTPPNMSPWEKAFMGWFTPVNLGNTGADLTLYANGTSQYVAYQINSSGTYQDYKTSGVCYYIENRQKTGWDAGVPGHGMLIWKVNYDQSIWEANEPNSSYDADYSQANMSGTISYTIVSASGKTTDIGTGADPFPGTGRKTSWSGISSKPLTDIQESNQLVSCKYMGGASACTGYSVSFVSTAATMTADAGFDADCVVAGMDFEGSFQMKNGYVYDSVVVTMGGRVLSEEEVEYMADESGIIVSDIQGDVIITLYGHKNGGGSFSDCDAYSWTASKALSDGSNTLGDWSWTLDMTGSTYKGYDTNNTPSKGAQFGSGSKPASQVSLTTNETADCMIDQVKVNASIASSGTGKLAVYIDGTQVGDTQILTTSATEYTFANTDELQGSLEIRYTNTAKALYLKSVNVSFVAPTPTALEPVTSNKGQAKKVVRNGQLVIIRDGKTYNIFGNEL